MEEDGYGSEFWICRLDEKNRVGFSFPVTRAVACGWVSSKISTHRSFYPYQIFPQR